MLLMKNVRLVATDLDGTFLKNDRTISHENLFALERLGKSGIVRVAATGRNLRKVEEVISSDVPFDFVVFSSGAGVYDWKKKKLLVGRNIGQESSSLIASFLINRKISFHAFFPVPLNHYLWYYRGAGHCEEFERYFSFHNSWAKKLALQHDFKGGLCQFLIIIREDLEKFEWIRNEIEGICDEVRVIRSSSPITSGYIWAEIFHRSVSKGNGILQICRHTGIDPADTFSIGNDYNDLDMLKLTAHSYLTDNAPEEIKSHFLTIPSNEEDGFAHAVQILLR